MDDDAVLSALGDELTREDPRLAAALTGPLHAPGPHLLRWTAATLAVLALVLLVPPMTALGIAALVLVVGSPVLAWYCCVFPDDRPAPGPG